MSQSDGNEAERGWRGRHHQGTVYTQHLPLLVATAFYCSDNNNVVNNKDNNDDDDAVNKKNAVNRKNAIYNNNAVKTKGDPGGDGLIQTRFADVLLPAVLTSH